MTNTAVRDQRFQRLATQAFRKLGQHREDRRVLSVECHRGHTLAAVYSTGEGPVFRSHPHQKDLDERDLTGRQHHRTDRRQDFLDMLGSSWIDDDLPASCSCGDHVLSRTALEAAIKAGRRLVIVY